MLTISDINTYYGTTVIRTTINSSQSEVVDTIPVSYFRSAKYILQMTQGTNYQVIELLLLHNNSTPNFIEYGNISSSIIIGNISASISSNILNLRVTRVNSSVNMDVLVYRVILRNAAGSDSITFQ